MSYTSGNYLMDHFICTLTAVSLNRGTGIRPSHQDRTCYLAILPAVILARVRLEPMLNVLKYNTALPLYLKMSRLDLQPTQTLSSAKYWMKILPGQQAQALTQSFRANQLQRRHQTPEIHSAEQLRQRIVEDLLSPKLATAHQPNLNGQPNHESLCAICMLCRHPASPSYPAAVLSLHWILFLSL
jgi:hypothetical protein